MSEETFVINNFSSLSLLDLAIAIMHSLFSPWGTVALHDIVCFMLLCSALTRVVSMRETDVSKYRNRYRRRAHRKTFRPAVSAPTLGGEPPISEEVGPLQTPSIIIFAVYLL